MTFKVLLLPLTILPLIITGLGISWGLAAIGVFIRDINHLTAFISTALMYASAIVYPPSKVSHNIWIFLKLNPIPVIIDQSRRIILWNENINYSDLCMAYATSTIILLTGYGIFYKLRPYFAEVI